MTDHGENTNVVVNRMLSKRRRMRVPVIIGSLLGVAFLVYMGIEFGSRKNSSELQVDGPVYTGNPINKPEDPQAPPGTDKGHGGPAPTGKPARVDVVITGKGAQLWVDGRSVAVSPKLSLQLSAGKHTLMVTASGRTMAEKLTLDAGDTYHVEFADKVTVTKQQ